MSGLISQELKARGVSQVIVVLKAPPPASARPSAAAGMTAAAGFSGDLERLSKHFISSEVSQTGAIAMAASEGRGVRAATRARRQPVKVNPNAPPPARYYPNLGVMLGTVTSGGLAALRADPAVKSVSGAPALRLIRPVHVAAAAAQGQVTWGIKAMNVPLLWKQGLTGNGVLVGHLDTGADGKHPALKGAIAHFTEFDEFGRQMQPNPKPYDTDEHGTHTAATIAGRPVQARRVGVAPGSKLASAIVIEGGDVLARVLGGMDWAVGLGVRVLSMSLGFPGYLDDFLALTRLLRSRNILPVFAVGNEGPGTSRSPGNYAEALSVGAHDKLNRVADFSSSDHFRRKKDAIVPDLLAPGVDVVSAMPGGSWQVMSGTSMATPHVAGLAALLMEAKPQRTAAQIESAIFKSAERPAGISEKRGNRGIPDGVRALAHL